MLADLQRRGLPVRAGVVRAALRIPLSALRRGHAARRPPRAAPGARAVARAGRGAGRGRHRALRRLVGRAGAGEGDGHDRARGTSSPATAGACRCIRRARPASSSPASATARGSRRAACTRRFPCTRRWCSTSSTRGTRRSIGGCTYHVSHPGGRSYETLPGERLRGREPPAGALLRHRPHAGPMAVPPEERNPDFPFTLDLRARRSRRSMR